jgi:hypothetical protein
MEESKIKTRQSELGLARYATPEKNAKESGALHKRSKSGLVMFQSVKLEEKSTRKKKKNYDMKDVRKDRFAKNEFVARRSLLD